MSIAMTPRRRLASGVLIVAVLAVLAAGSFVVWQDGRDGGAQRTATGPGPTSPVSIDPNAPPELRTTGEDWDGIVRSILGYQDWLFTHPKPELLDNIMLPTFSQYQDHKLGLTNLATKGWRYDPEYRPATVTLIRLFERPRSDMAVVFVRTFGFPARIVDPAGKVIQDTPGVGDVSVLWTLKNSVGGDARWKLDKVTPFTDAPPKP